MRTPTKQRADRIKSALNWHFDCKSCDPKYNAQQNLQPIGHHYVDDDTLRYFSARVQYSSHIAGGLLFLVKSTVGEGKTGGRGRYRVTVFDLLGHCVEDFDGNSAKDALSKYQEWQRTFNVLDHYRTEGKRRIENLKREASELGKALR